MMDLGPQIPLNVLSKTKREQENTLAEVAAMINNSGMNRGQRRRLEKALKKTETITSHSQKKLDKSAFKEYQNCLDQSMTHFFAAMAMCMYEQYHWKEDDTHDQISSLMVRLSRTIDKYAAQGYTTEDLTKLVEDKTGIVLVPEKH